MKCHVASIVGRVATVVGRVATVVGRQCCRGLRDSRLWGAPLLFGYGGVLWVRGGPRVWNSILPIIVSVALSLSWIKL